MEVQRLRVRETNGKAVEEREALIMQILYTNQRIEKLENRKTDKPRELWQVI